MKFYNWSTTIYRIVELTMVLALIFWQSYEGSLWKKMMLASWRIWTLWRKVRNYIDHYLIVNEVKDSEQPWSAEYSTKGDRTYCIPGNNRKLFPPRISQSDSLLRDWARLNHKLTIAYIPGIKRRCSLERSGSSPVQTNVKYRSLDKPTQPLLNVCVVVAHQTELILRNCIPEKHSNWSVPLDQCTALLLVLRGFCRSLSQGCNKMYAINAITRCLGKMS